jgi:hypothetical protein
MGGHDNIPPVQIIDMETIISIVRRREHLFPIFGFRFPVSDFRQGQSLQIRGGKTRKKKRFSLFSVQPASTMINFNRIQVLATTHLS